MNRRIATAIAMVISIPLFLTLLLFSYTKRTQPSEYHVSPNPLESTAYFDISDIKVLEGQMRLYDGVLLNPTSLRAGSHPYRMINDLEDVFSDTCIVDGKYTATVVFYMNLPRAEHYSAWLPSLFTEYKVFVNDYEVLRSLTWDSKYSPYPNSKIFDFPYNDDGKYEIVLNIQSHENFWVSASSAIIFGESAALNEKHDISIRATISFFAAIAFIAIFCLIQASAIKNEPMLTAFLSFTLASLLCACFTDDIAIMHFLPFLPYQVGVILRSLSTPLYLIALVRMANAMFPDHFPKFLAHAFMILQVIPLTSMLCFEQVKILVTLSAMITILPYSICMYVFIFAYERRDPYSLSYGIATLFVETNILVSYATEDMAIPARYTYGFGITAFTIVELIIIAKKYATQNRDELFYKEELAKQLEAMQASENAFLNAQMKPHFLYNTLNTIADLCVTEPNKAKHLIMSLTEYLKLVLTLDNMEETVPLRRELELAESYIDIEHERFPSISFNKDYPLRMPIIMMPPIIIQPLIENAIKHGVRKADKPGMVTIRVIESDDEVSFYVSDNGTGMDQATIDKLFEVPKGNKSIGIYNINKRLISKYGKGLIVESTPGLGTSVSFSIPRHKP